MIFPSFNRAKDGEDGAAHGCTIPAIDPFAPGMTNPVGFAPRMEISTSYKISENLDFGRKIKQESKHDRSL